MPIFCRRRGIPMKQPYYEGLDPVKLICALLIVVLHTEAFASVSAPLNSLFVNGLARIAVPFFFACSGFLFFCQTKHPATGEGHLPNEGYPANGKSKLPDGKALRRYLRRILWLYLFWSAVYFPFTLTEMVRVGSPSGAVATLLIYLKNMVFSAGYGFLWYLPATTVAVGLVWWMRKRGLPLPVVLAVGGILYSIGLCGQSYFGLVRPWLAETDLWPVLKTVYGVIGTTRNGLFEGVVMVALGAAMAARPSPPRRGLSWLGLGLSLLLLLMEIAFVTRRGWKLAYDMYLMLLPCTWFLLSVALNFSAKTETGRNLCRICRPYSSLIYFLHMLPTELVRALSLRRMIGSLGEFLLVLTLTVLLAAAIRRLSRKEHRRFWQTVY